MLIESICLCENPSCGAYRWTPTVQSADANQMRTGIAEEFGVYDDLLSCVGTEDPWLEYGIVEYRFARLRPDLEDRRDRSLRWVIPQRHTEVSGSSEVPARRLLVSGWFVGCIPPMECRRRA